MMMSVISLFDIQFMTLIVQTLKLSQANKKLPFESFFIPEKILQVF